MLYLAIIIIVVVSESLWPIGLFSAEVPIFGRAPSYTRNCFTIRQHTRLVAGLKLHPLKFRATKR